MAPIRTSDLSFDPQKLVEALEVLQARFPLHPEFMQLSLTHSSRASSPYERAYDGLGSLFDFEKRAYRRDPSEFVHFNEAFKDLYFYDVYCAVTKWSQHRLGRVRLMRRPPSSCYSMHADEGLRLHIAVTSNQDCYFYFKGAGIAQIPTDGRVYFFDATIQHTGFNAGKTDRVHLVFDSIEWRFTAAGKDIQLLSQA